MREEGVARKGMVKSGGRKKRCRSREGKEGNKGKWFERGGGREEGRERVKEDGGGKIRTVTIEGGKADLVWKKWGKGGRIDGDKIGNVGGGRGSEVTRERGGEKGYKVGVRKRQRKKGIRGGKMNEGNSRGERGERRERGGGGDGRAGGGMGRRE